MGLWMIITMLAQEEPSSFGTSHAEVPVVGRPNVDDSFGKSHAEVPVVGRPNVDDSFGKTHAEVPVVARPDVHGLGWSLPIYRARSMAESFAFAPMGLSPPSLPVVSSAATGTVPQTSVSISPPATPAASAPAPVPGGSGSGRP